MLKNPWSLGTFYCLPVLAATWFVILLSLFPIFPLATAPSPQILLFLTWKSNYLGKVLPFPRASLQDLNLQLIFQPGLFSTKTFFFPYKELWHLLSIFPGRTSPVPHSKLHELIDWLILSLCGEREHARLHTGTHAHVYMWVREGQRARQRENPK